MYLINVGRKISLLGIVSAIFGFVLSFQQVYLFHICVLLFLMYTVFINSKIDLLTFKYVSPVFFFLIYSIVTLLWAIDPIVGIRNLFYLFCGFFCVYFVVNYCKNFNDLSYVFKILVYLACLNFFVGILETLGIFRLPMSPLSEYASFFGYSQSDLNLIDSSVLNSVLERPTGFNGNPNNFGFFLAIFTPFLFYYNFKLKFFIVFLLIWFNLYSQSRGLFLASIVFFLIVYFQNFSKNLKYLPFLIIIVIIYYSYNIDLSKHRFSSTFDSIYIGYDLIKNGVISDPKSSTDIRSFIYSLGIYHLYDNYILGLGIGGIQSVLIDMDFKIQSFHFYFLELLIDYGIPFYIFILFFYFRLILKLSKISRANPTQDIGKIAKCCAAALVIMPFASISPSSIVYILSAWVVLGLSLAVVKVDSK